MLDCLSGNLDPARSDHPKGIKICVLLWLAQLPLILCPTFPLCILYPSHQLLRQPLQSAHGPSRPSQLILPGFLQESDNQLFSRSDEQLFFTEPGTASVPLVRRQVRGCRSDQPGKVWGSLARRQPMEDSGSLRWWVSRVVA